MIRTVRPSLATAVLCVLLGAACSSESKPQPQTPSQSSQTASSIMHEPFGTTTDGKPVEVYTLRNANGMEARVINYGGIIVSLKVPDRNGQLGDVVLGFDSLTHYETDSPYFGALIGRYGNRIAKGQFTLDGTTYHLPINNAPNSLHGGTKGFDKLLWHAEPFERAGERGLVLTRTSPDGEDGYPGNLQARVTYTLNDWFGAKVTAPEDRRAGEQ